MIFWRSIGDDMGHANQALQNGPLNNKEIKELNLFLRADDGLEDPMDFFTFDGFICAVLSAPNSIPPSEWLRWVWDQKQGAQAPEFASERQAKRILSLLIGHANVLAFTRFRHSSLEGFTSCPSFRAELIF